METGRENVKMSGASFGIEDTMQIGAGNAELLKDLMDDSSSGDPDDVKPIEEPETKQQDKKEQDKKKADEGKEQEEEEQEQENVIESFLDSSEEEEEEEEEEDDKEKLANKPKIEKEEEQEEGDDQEEGSNFSALAKDLLNLGVFTSDEEEEDLNIKTPEEFLERFNSEKKKGAIEMVDKFIGQFGEDYQKAFEAIFVNGTNPKQYFDVYNDVADFSDLDLTTESNQELVVRKALADQGLEPEDVDTEVERLKNYGDLEPVSKRYHKVIVKKQAAKLKELEENSKAELQRKANIKNQYIQNVQTILQDKVREKSFDGIPLNPKLAAELQDFLLVDKYKTASGETLTDFDRTILELKRPENHATKVKIGLLLKILEKDPSLSTIQRSGVTKKSNELFSEVARQVTKTKKTDEKSPQKASSINKWFL